MVTIFCTQQSKCADLRAALTLVLQDLKLLSLVIATATAIGKVQMADPVSFADC